MTNIVAGCIFHWQEYEFSDGQKADKYFVILGAKQGRNYLAVIATSQPHKRKFVAGCNEKEGYYHIPGGKKEWFPKDTWLLLAEPKEVSPAEFLKLALSKAITLSGNLREEIANAIRNCIKKCQDISQAQIDLL